MLVKKLTIGVLARQAGVNIETVRYYQRIGLITEPDKPQSGYRQYPSATIERILFIQRAQLLGFTLAEIAHLLELEDGNCAETRVIAEQKLSLIESKIQHLQTMADVLRVRIQTCKLSVDDQPCPLIASLTKDKN
jgi:MerR family mercuric resistance operon transcriptional regulator